MDPNSHHSLFSSAYKNFDIGNVLTSLYDVIRAYL